MRHARLLLLAACAACAVSLWVWWTWRPALEALLGVRAYVLLATLLLAPVLCLRAPRASSPVRAALVAGGLAWIGFLVCVSSYQRLWLELALGPALGLFALILRLECVLERWRPGPAKLVRALLVALALGAPLCEASLRVLARLRPSPLLARDERSPGRLLEQNRAAPGTRRFGTPWNSGGHFDEEFTRRRPGETRVALIGDSFSQGIVPHGMHYSTVAERALGFPVDNFGVAGIGPLEYEELLVREVLPLDPSAVVIALFVGNDLDLPPEEVVRDPRLHSWLDRQSVLLWQVPGRLVRIAEERRTNPAGAARVQGESAQVSPSEALRFPWLADPLLETPTISLPGFQELEGGRARQACSLTQAELARVLRVLERMREECGARPFAVLLIPDEFQVEDALWNELHTEELERDRPQRMLKEELEKRGIPVLDLEPVLRAIAPLADGRRHVYQLRDTHWNARGNRAAGEALAHFVRGLLRNGR